MISQTIEYALRAVVALAAGGGAPLTTKQIAKAMRMPPSYLSKVLQALVRAGLVHSTRGLRGGFVLIVPPDRLRLLDVVNAVSPLPRIRSCPLETAAHGSGLCPLHRRLDEAVGRVEEAFAGTTLADLIAEDNPCTTLQGQLADLRREIGGGDAPASA